MANELFLCATAWILHHEIAHVRLGHGSSPTIYSVQQEKDADREATEWILSRSEVRQESRKRALGIVVAILTLHALESSGPKPRFRTHPAALERLDRCLTGANVTDEDQVCAFAAAIVQVHLAQRGITAELDASSFRHILDGLLLAEARAKTR